MRKVEWRHWRRSGVFIVNFEHILHLFLVILSLSLNRWRSFRGLHKILDTTYESKKYLEIIFLPERNLLWASSFAKQKQQEHSKLDQKLKQSLGGDNRWDSSNHSKLTFDQQKHLFASVALVLLNFFMNSAFNVA